MAAAQTFRILIIDDSGVMRSLLRSVLACDPQLTVAGTASNGLSGLQAVEALRPDLVLLDVDMPVMDGLTTLRTLRARGICVPVIMCSALTQRGARVTIEALADGASDYVTKPSGQEDRSAAIATLAAELLPKIAALLRRTPTRAAAPLVAHPSQGRVAESTPPAVVAIGVSTGGPAALEQILPSLPASFPLPLLVVQHMPELFTGLLADRLSARCSLRVVEAAQGMTVVPGRVVIARGNWHMEVAAATARTRPASLILHQSALENHCRPAVDALLRSVARVYGAAAVGIILTGMGSDGLAGCRALRQAGATVLAQNEASSTVWGMPGAVVNARLAHSVLPLNEIAAEIQRLAALKRTA